MYPIAEYFNRISVFPSVALSPDGGKLAYQSSLTGSPQIWLGGVPNKGGLLAYPRPLTNGKDKQPHVVIPEALLWAGKDVLLTLMDQHGDEQTFIEVHNFKTGEVKTVPRAEGARDYLGFVSKDHKTLYFGSNRGNPVAQGLFTYNFKTEKVERWFQHETESAWWAGSKTYKGHLLFIRASATNSNTLHAIHPKTKKVIDLYTEPGAIVGPICALSGDRLLVVTNHGRQFLSLAEFNPKTMQFKFLGKDLWDVESVLLSENKKHLLISRNIAGRSQLALHSWPSMKKIKIKAPNAGVIDGLSFAENSRFAVFGYSSPTEPRNFYRLDLKTKVAQQLTDNWTSRIPKSHLAPSKEIIYKSNGKNIYSWLLLPKSAKKNANTPVIIWPHGGPQWQERAQFRPIFQYFVGRGYAIWAPNPTGSTGFGKDFCDAICGQWGTADLPDMVNGIAWLKASGWIDPKRIAIMGGSYGGYMTLRALTKIGQTFKAGVDIFGVCNLLTFVNTVPPDWRPFMDHLVGNAERDHDKLREQSPLFSIDKIDCPLMVIQGAKDPRVVKAESDQVVETLKKHGHTVEYLVFEDEGHGFLKLENELKAYATAAEFLERYL